MYFCVVLYIFFVSFSALFEWICVANYCHRVATQLQLNISYHIKLAARWRWGVNATPRLVHPRLRDPVLIVQEAGWGPGR